MTLFKVFRYSPATAETWKEYRLELNENASVLDGLHAIRSDHDSTLAYRFSCRSSVCGSCAMWINGRPRLACQTKVGQLKSAQVVVGPLRGLPVIKDLIVDMQPLWDAYRKVMPWLVEKPNAKDMVVTKKVSDRVERFYSCILCAACFASCPEAAQKHSYLGPMPLMDGYRMYIDPRDDATQERKQVLGGPDGVWGCHGAFACIESCPWDVAPVEFIAELRRELVRDQFGGR